MTNFIGTLILLSVAILGTTIGTTNAQSDDNSSNNMGNGTTGSVVNLTNASSSLQDAQNMSAIEGTMNQTG